MNLQFFLSAAAQTELFRQSRVKARPVTIRQLGTKWAWSLGEKCLVQGARGDAGTEMTRRPAQDTSYIKQLARWWPGWRDESEFV